MTPTTTEDPASNRVLIRFEDEPPDKVRQLLTASGFRYSPVYCAWCRVLNDRGREACRQVLDAIRRVTA